MALDSTFVQAWSQLSRARSSLYSNGVPVPELGEQARVAAERARQLKPKDPSVYLAIGDYYGSVNPIDNEQAVAGIRRGTPAGARQRGPPRCRGDHRNQPGTLGRRGIPSCPCHTPRSALGEHLPPACSRSTPFSGTIPQRTPPPTAPSHWHPPIPTIVLVKVLIALARGDLDSARAVVKRTETQIDPGTLLPFMALYQDLYWVLDDEEQRQVLAAPPNCI